ncbi:MAG: sigma factor-like helix-turn-helix DNA-binding protein, partial [Phycisphaerae bacterium]
LNGCIERLEPAERDLIRWRFFEGQSLRAVAQRLGIAESTVRENRLPAAMASIQRCLRAKGIDDRLFGFSTAQSTSSTQ